MFVSQVVVERDHDRAVRDPQGACGHDVFDSQGYGHNDLPVSGISFHGCTHMPGQFGAGQSV